MSSAKLHAAKKAMYSLVELEQESKEGLDAMVHGYYASGADSELTVADNRLSFSRYKMLPRMLVDVSKLCTKTCILGCDLSFPVIIAPMAMQQMAHPDGEIAVARAAKAAGIVMCVSTMANYALDKVAQQAGPEHLWFQLYVFRDRELVTMLVRDAEAAGYRALVVTVDAPFLGNREADVRNRFKLPEGMTLENAERAKRAQPKSTDPNDTASGIAEIFVNQIDDSLTWDLIRFLKTITSLPVIVKGILHPQDAALAVTHGADGIVVSNHGGRQLDTAVAPMDVLEAISGAVRGRVPLLLDGGIRRGTDVVKAIALGATAVMLGRPVLYGLARDGQAGVEQVLAMLKKEVRLAMALSGTANVGQIAPQLLVHQSQLPLLRSAL